MADKPLIWTPSTTGKELKLWTPGQGDGVQIAKIERRPIEVIRDPKLARELDKRFRAWGQ